MGLGKTLERCIVVTVGGLCVVGTILWLSACQHKAAPIADEASKHPNEIKICESKVVPGKTPGTNTVESVNCRWVKK